MTRARYSIIIIVLPRCSIIVRIYGRLTTCVLLCMFCIYWNETQPRNIMIKIYLWRILSYLCCLIFPGCYNNVILFSSYMFFIYESLGILHWENYVIKHKITDLLMKCFLYISYIFFCVIYECWWSLVRVIYTYFCFHKMSKRIINFCFSIDSRKKDL